MLATLPPSTGPRPSVPMVCHDSPYLDSPWNSNVSQGAEPLEELLLGQNASDPTTVLMRTTQLNPQESEAKRVTVWNRVTKRKISGNAAPKSGNLPRYLLKHPNCEIYTGQDRLLTTEEKQTLIAEQHRIPIWNRVEMRKISGNAAPSEKNLAEYLRDRPHCEVFCGQKANSTMSRTISQQLAYPVAPEHKTLVEQVVADLGVTTTTTTNNQGLVGQKRKWRQTSHSNCEHGRKHCMCMESGGTSICEHGQQTWQCGECVIVDMLASSFYTKFNGK